MTQQIATIPQHRPPSRVEQFMAKVMTEEDRAALKSALPQHISFARFERNLSNAMMNEPRLMDCSPREVFREVAKIAALGLLIDAQLGEAYLIASRTGPQARVGYRGLIKLARQSGDIALIYAHEVYENDEIECTLGDDKKLNHKPNLFGARGAIVGYYAVVKFKDGATDFEPMTVEQINKIRDLSDGWRAFKNGKIKSTPWASSYDEMAKKTCIRRLMKRCPQSPELADAFEMEDKAEVLEIAPNVAQFRPVLNPLADEAPQIEAKAVEPAHDPETGEIAPEKVLVVEADENGRVRGHMAAFAAADRVVTTDGRVLKDRRNGAAEPAQSEKPETATEAPETAESAPAADFYARGMQAARDGASRRAIPGELRDKSRENDARSWLAGYDSASAE